MILYDTILGHCGNIFRRDSSFRDVEVFSWHHFNAIYNRTHRIAQCTPRTVIFSNLWQMSFWIKINCLKDVLMPTLRMVLTTVKIVFLTFGVLFLMSGVLFLTLEIAVLTLGIVFLTLEIVFSTLELNSRIISKLYN